MGMISEALEELHEKEIKELKQKIKNKLEEALHQYSLDYGMEENQGSMYFRSRRVRCILEEALKELKL